MRIYYYDHHHRFSFIFPRLLPQRKTSHHATYVTIASKAQIRLIKERMYPISWAFAPTFRRRTSAFLSSRLSGAERRELWAFPFARRWKRISLSSGGVVARENNRVQRESATDIYLPPLLHTPRHANWSWFIVIDPIVANIANPRDCEFTLSDDRRYDGQAQRENRFETNTCCVFYVKCARITSRYYVINSHQSSTPFLRDRRTGVFSSKMPDAIGFVDP